MSESQNKTHGDVMRAVLDHLLDGAAKENQEAVPVLCELQTRPGQILTSGLRRGPVPGAYRLEMPIDTPQGRRTLPTLVSAEMFLTVALPGEMGSVVVPNSPLISPH